MEGTWSPEFVFPTNFLFSQISGRILRQLLQLYLFYKARSALTLSLNLGTKYFQIQQFWLLLKEQSTCKDYNCDCFLFDAFGITENVFIMFMFPTALGMKFSQGVH